MLSELSTVSHLAGRHGAETVHVGRILPSGGSTSETFYVEIPYALITYRPCENRINPRQNVNVSVRYPTSNAERMCRHCAPAVPCSQHGRVQLDRHSSLRMGSQVPTKDRAFECVNVPPVCNARKCPHVSNASKCLLVGTNETAARSERIEIPPC